MKNVNIGFMKVAKQWEQAIQDLEEIFQIRVTIHDLAGAICSPGGELPFAYRGMHRHPLCQRLAPGQLWAGQCVQYCQFAVRARLEKQPHAFVSHCPRGLSEAVVPIYVRDRLQLIFFGGPFRTGLDQEKRFPPEVREAYRELPLYTARQVGRLQRLLELIGQGIFTQAQQWGAGSYGMSRREMILAFLQNHACDSATELAMLAKELHLSSGRTGHLVRELFGMPFSQLLRQEKIRRAKVLLVTTGLTAREISQQTGFQTPYYFSQVFRQETGHSPLQYRRKNTD